MNWSRTVFGAIATLGVTAGLACTQSAYGSVRESISLTDVKSDGVEGAASNAVVTRPLAGGYKVRALHISGVLTQVNSKSDPFDSTVAITAPGGQSIEFYVDDFGSFSEDFLLDEAIDAAGTWSFRFFEFSDADENYNGDDPGIDARWTSITFTFDDGATSPPPATDLGTLTGAGLTISNRPLAPEEVAWYRFTLERPATIDQKTYLDISSAGSILSADPDWGEEPNDTFLALFSAEGFRIAMNPDEDPDHGVFTSLLSFGSGGGGARHGQDGALQPGVYYLAASATATANLGFFDVSADTEQSGTLTLRFSTNAWNNACDTPHITTPPVDAAVDEGLSAEFSVTVSGTGPFSYRWQHNGIDIPGQTGPTLFFSAAKTTDAGMYTVIVSNICGPVSASASLNVRCLVDFDGNGFVNGEDYDAFIAAFERGDQNADYDGNGFVNGEDYDAYAQAFLLSSCTRCPEPPCCLSSILQSAVCARVSWVNTSAITNQFQVESSENGTDYSLFQIASAGDTSLAFCGSPGGTYWLRVRALSAECSSEPSQPIQIHFDLPPCPKAPYGLSASDVWDDTIDLRWSDASNNEDSFGVDRLVNGTWQRLSVLPANTAKIRLRTGITPSTDYVFRIVAINACGEAESNHLRVRSGPARPVNIRVTDLAPTDAIVRWDDVSSDESTFQIWLERLIGSDWVREQTITDPANDTGRHLSPPNLFRSSHYRVTVRSFRSDGSRSGIWSWIEFDTPSGAPAAPTALFTSDVWDDTIDLRWTDNASNESGFQVQRAVNGGWQTVANVAANPNGGQTSVRLTSTQNTAISPSTNYIFRIVAVNANGASDPSNEFAVRSGPARPTKVHVGNLWTTAIDVSFDDNSVDEDYFLVYWEPWNGTSATGPADSVRVDAGTKLGRSARITGLLSKHRYRIWVRAFRNDGSRSGIAEYLDVTMK